MFYKNGYIIIMRKRFIWKDWNLPLSSFNDIEDFDDDDDSIFDIQQDIKKDSGIELFLLHTNFIIEFDILEGIIAQKLKGLEVLKPLTSYKLLVGIPSSGLFKADKVKKKIEEVFLEHDILLNNQFDNMISIKFEPEIAKSIIATRKSLYESRDYWILYVFPNAQVEIITDTDESEYFLQCLEDLSSLYFMIGGTIISSTFYELPNE